VSSEIRIDQIFIVNLAQVKDFNRIDRQDNGLLISIGLSG